MTAPRLANKRSIHPPPPFLTHYSRNWSRHEKGGWRSRLVWWDFGKRSTMPNNKIKRKSMKWISRRKLKNYNDFVIKLKRGLAAPISRIKTILSKHANSLKPKWNNSKFVKRKPRPRHIPKRDWHEQNNLILRKRPNRLRLNGLENILKNSINYSKIGKWKLNDCLRERAKRRISTFSKNTISILPCTSFISTNSRESCDWSIMMSWMSK